MKMEKKIEQIEMLTNDIEDIILEIKKEYEAKDEAFKSSSEGREMEQNIELGEHAINLLDEATSTLNKL